MIATPQRRAKPSLDQLFNQTNKRAINDNLKLYSQKHVVKGQGDVEFKIWAPQDRMGQDITRFRLPYGAAAVAMATLLAQGGYKKVPSVERALSPVPSQFSILEL